jgi:hypothetical protein
MANPLSGFGKFLKLKGKSWGGDSTAVPLPLLQNLKTNTPIPVAQTASTFVVNAGVTAPVNLWNGNDFIQLKETKTYTWATTGTLTLNSSGATVAATVSGAGVMYYYYLAQDTAGAYQLAASPTYPRNVEGPYEGGFWMHPGTSRTKYWNYVGFQQCTATTPVMLVQEKRGFNYYTPTPTAMGVDNIATVSTSAKSVTFGALVPVHGAELGGYITNDTTTAANVSLDIGATSLAANAFRATTQSITYPATASFHGLVPDTSGNLWATCDASHATSGDIVVTVVKDVI